MSTKMRYALELLLVGIIILLSIIVFVFRENLGDISNIGYLGLFALCFLANSTVLLPSPSLMIAASCALIMNPFLVAVVGALGSSLGEFTGYIFGLVTKDISSKACKLFDYLKSKVHNQLLLIFLLAVLPLPLFDIAGIYAGGTKLSQITFYLVCFCGKFIKMLVYTHMYIILEWAMLLVQ